MNQSPDREESPEKEQEGEQEREEENNGNDEPQRDQESPVESPEGQAVYDRHQLDGQNYEEQEGEDYQYDEEGKNTGFNQEEEETKRLYDENEEEIQPIDREHEQEIDDEDPIQKKIRAIIELCEQTNGMYGDSDFPPNDASLYFNPAEPPDYAEGTPVVEWMRPEEALKSGDSDKVAMIKNGMKPGDVKQGTLGDCWFLGSLMVLGTHPELLQNLIVKDCIKYGFAVFQFFKNGDWKQVLVDTRIPYNRETKTPLYGHCADPTEVWVPLMEKAYAKLHGCYQALNGGLMSEALVDLTGGVSEKILLESPETIEIRDNGVLWKELVKYYQQGYSRKRNRILIKNISLYSMVGELSINFSHFFLQ